MAVTTGTRILLSEHNSVKTQVDTIFGDNYPSITFGGANQIFGWGGANAPAASGRIEASEMNPLVDRLNVGENVISTISGTLSQIPAGTRIDAADYNVINTRANLVISQRNNIDPAELSVSAGTSSARAGTWSGGIDCEFSYTFTSFARARYFFNTGGAFNILASIVGYSVGTGWDGAGFNQIFTNMGTIWMDRTATTQTGSGGTPSSIGFYDLTTSNQLIFQQAGTGAYSNAFFQIYARRNSTGSIVYLLCGLSPEAGRSVNGTTTITTQKRKLDNQSSGTASLTIVAPTAAVTNPL